LKESSQLGITTNGEGNPNNASIHPCEGKQENSYAIISFKSFLDMIHNNPREFQSTWISLVRYYKMLLPIFFQNDPKTNIGCKLM
jgi:hypothetical protein